VNGGGGLVPDRAAFVDRLTDHVHDPAQRFRSHRHHDLRTGVGHFLTAGQAFGRIHGDRANGVLAEMLRNLENQPVAVIVGFQSRENCRDLAIKGDVDDSADDL